MISKLLEDVINAKSLEELERIEKQIDEFNPDKIKITYADAIRTIIDRIGIFFNAERVDSYIPYVSRKRLTYHKIRDAIESLKPQDVRDCLNVYKHKDCVLCILNVLAKRNSFLKKLYQDYKEKNKTSVVFITNVLKEKNVEQKQKKKV